MPAQLTRMSTPPRTLFDQLEGRGDAGSVGDVAVQLRGTGRQLGAELVSGAGGVRQVEPDAVGTLGDESLGHDSAQALGGTGDDEAPVAQGSLH